MVGLLGQRDLDLPEVDLLHDLALLNAVDDSGKSASQLASAPEVT
jgi:hypothetical protein